MKDLRLDLLYGFDEDFLEILQYGCEGNAWIAGGAITSVYTHSNINDYDLYFEKRSDVEKIMPYLLDYSTISFVSDKAITFNISGQIYQIIYYNEFKSSNDIFRDFDFTINNGAFNLKTFQFELGNRFEYSLKDREVRFNFNTKYPILSACRIDKYERKGFRFNKLTKMQIFATIANLKCETIEEFCEQIGGYYGNNIDVERFKDDYGDNCFFDWVRYFHLYLNERNSDLFKKVDTNWNSSSNFQKLKDITRLDFDNKYVGIDDFLPEDIICPACRKEIGEFRDALSEKEAMISGLCQKCQDKVF